MSPNRPETRAAVERWQQEARERGIICAGCGQIPPYEERVAFFELGLCAWCYRQAGREER
jgi:hypothetical protein